MNYQEKYQELKQSYLRSLGVKETSLAKAWKDMDKEKNRNLEATDFRLQVHQLAGSAGSYELKDVYGAAKRLEAVLLSPAEHGNWQQITEERLSELQALLRKYSCDR